MLNEYPPENGCGFLFNSDSVPMDTETSHDDPGTAVAWDLGRLREQPPSVDFPHQGNLAVAAHPGAISSPLGLSGDTRSTSHPKSPGGFCSGQANDDITSETQQGFPPLTSPLVPVAISSQERYLMSHYRDRVVNLFCVIDNAKSPWKTIHLPRVLQCAGELSIGGTTTRILDALRKSLLSISAFYLSNDHRTHRRNDDAESWGTVASRYRCDAIGLLKHAVETDLYAGQRPKYKDFLATMLSMITINARRILFPTPSLGSSLILLAGYLW